MQPYGGLVVVISYAGGHAVDTALHLITQSGIDIITQDNKDILVQE